MDLEKFVDNYFEELVSDDEIKGYLDSNDPEKTELLKDRLRGSLKKSYANYANDYFDSKGIGSYLSTFLRKSGSVADVVGTYMFWAMGGAGFGLKGAGLVGKSVADAIDNYHYLGHAKAETLSDKAMDEAKIVGEGLAERAAAYLPLGVGEVADFLRGRSKFDDKVINYAVKYAKNEFLDYVRDKIEKGPKIVPLGKFRNPEYADKPLERKVSGAPDKTLVS